MARRSPVSPQTVAEQVRESRKYRDVDAQLVLHLSELEASHARSEQDALKGVKRKLHQMIGAYLEARMPYEKWLEALRTAGDESERRRICGEILASHASTRERLPELAAIYAAVFRDVQPTSVVADLACGLNPLTRFYMPLAPDALYIAVDAHGGLTRFLGEALSILGMCTRTFTHDLLAGAPAMDADVVLLLKTLPCLEQADREAGRRLLNELTAPLIIVSYPTRSLGGSNRGMEHFYSERFAQVLPPNRFEVEMHRFETELVFRLRRHTSHER
jgi:16S rRNA (guanine(1405)-N(7))-methyltransferase